MGWLIFGGLIMFALAALGSGGRYYTHPYYRDPDREPEYDYDSGSSNDCCDSGCGDDR